MRIRTLRTPKRLLLAPTGQASGRALPGGTIGTIRMAMFHPRRPYFAFLPLCWVILTSKMYARRQRHHLYTRTKNCGELIIKAGPVWHARQRMLVAGSTIVLLTRICLFRKMSHLLHGATCGIPMFLKAGVLAQCSLPLSLERGLLY